jgi:hypothetical protein
VEVHIAIVSLVIEPMRSEACGVFMHCGIRLAQRGVPMAIIRDLLGHHSVTLTEKYYAHLAPNNMSTAVKQLETQPVKTSLPNSLPNCTKSENVAVENPTNAVPLTHSSARCYVPMVRSFAKVAELADALDLGSSGSRRGGSSPPFRISPE